MNVDRDCEMIDTVDGLKPTSETIYDLVTNGGAYAPQDVITMEPGTAVVVNGPQSVYVLRMDEDGPRIEDLNEGLNVRIKG